MSEPTDSVLPSHQIRGTVHGRAQARGRSGIVAIERGSREPLVVVYCEFPHARTRQRVTRATLAMRPEEARQLARLLDGAAAVIDATTPGAHGVPRGSTSPPTWARREPIPPAERTSAGGDSDRGLVVHA